MAGALSRRDIEMIFRAETDKATRPIADLGKAVKASRGELNSLVEAAERGEVSLDKLGTTTRDLKKAQDELGTARGLLTALNTQERAIEKAEASLDAASKKYADLKERVEAAEAPTKRLTGQMEAAGRAQAAAAETLDRVRSEAAETRAQIEAVIGPVNDINGAFRTIATTGADIARGLALAGAAADDFKAKIAAANVAAADTDRFNAAAAKSPLMAEQIAYISQFEDRIERLRDAEAAQASAQREAASADVLAKARQKAALDDVLQGNKALEAEIANVVAESERLARVAGFQQIAADARASVTDVQRFAVTEDQAAATAERFARSISMILAPGAAANRTLDSIAGSVLSASAIMEGKGAKSATDYNNALNELQSAAAGINRIAGQIDGFEDQARAVDKARASFAAAQAEALRLAGALDQPGEDAEQLARQLRQAEAAVESNGRALQVEEGKLATLSAALKRAGVDSNDLAQAQHTLRSAAEQTAASTTAIQGKLAGKGGFLGLSVQDATNLSYQLNDIFTQLASGQSIFITLAQQGPQIWQIGGIQKWISAAMPVLSILGGLAGGFGLVAAGAAGVYAATDDPRLDAFNARLTLLADKGSLTAAQMAATADKLEDLGLKAGEAQTVLLDLNANGFNPAYLTQFQEAVENAAQVMGIDAKDAAADLTTALTGNYDSVVELNDKYGILTDSELDNIRAMIESGREDEARQIIFDRMTGKLQDAADKMNGPWTNAWKNLKSAAADFGNYIAGAFDGILAGLRSRLDDAAIGVNYLLGRMKGLDHATAANAAVNEQGRLPTAPRPGRGAGGPIQTPRSTAAGRLAADDAERESKATRQTLTARQRINNAMAKARRDAAGRGYGSADVERLAQTAARNEQATIDRENAAAGRKAGAAKRKADAEAKRAARAAETLQNRIDSAEEQLQSALDAMQAKVSRVAAGTLQEQLSAAVAAVDQQYARVYRQLQEAQKLGVKSIGGKTIEQYRQQLDANKAILANQAQLKVYEDNLNDVLNQRKALLADIEDRAQRGQITNADAIRQTAEVTSRFEPVISSLTAAAVNFARSIGGASPSAELQAFIAKMERAGVANAGTDQQAARSTATAAIGRDENRLNQILAQRNDLVEQYNTLAQLGLITQDEARKRSAAAYNQAKVAIGEQSAALRATLDAARNAIDPQVYDALIAKLEAIGAQADYLDPRFAQLKQGIDNIVTQNALNLVNSLAENLGNAVAGTESWGDALKNAGLALLDFIAQTIRNVANLILQMLILDAVQKTTGIPVAALLGTQAPGQAGGGGGGLFGFLGRLFHAGGKVGDYGGSVQRSTRFSVSPAAIAAAPRYHDGTSSVGLKTNEQLAVLETGEKVLTEKQQREEAAAKARQQSGGRGLRQVLAFGDDQVAAAMAGAAGEDVTVTHLRRNVPLLKQLLDE